MSCGREGEVRIPSPSNTSADHPSKNAATSGHYFLRDVKLKLVEHIVEQNRADTAR
jgi:hypothetical protein